MFIPKINIRHKITAIPNIKRNLIRFTVFLILTLFIINFVLYYLLMRDTYKEQMEASNGSIVEQVAISYETVLKYIRDSVYKTSLYDSDLINLIQSYEGSTGDKQKVLAKLDSLVLFNEFIYSAYLYFPALDVVYSTASNNTDTLNSFSDQQVFALIKDKDLYNLDPRIAINGFSSQLVISTISSVPLTARKNKAFLAININAKKLYYDIIKKIKAESNMNFYVYNQSGAIIIHKDENSLFQQVPSFIINNSKISRFMDTYLKSNYVITSTYYSDYLKWTFVLDTEVQRSKDMSSKLNRFIAVSLFLIIASLFFTVFTISIYTKPVKGMLQKYNDKLWIDFVTDRVYITEEVKYNLEDGELKTSASRYGTIILQFDSSLPIGKGHQDLYGLADNTIKEFCKTGDVKFKLLATDKNFLTVLLCFPERFNSQWCCKFMQDLSDTIYMKTCTQNNFSLYISISSVKEQFYLLPISYKECIEVLNFKLIYNSPILDYAYLLDKDSEYIYPIDLERHLVNNMLVGNGDGCKLYIEEFFKVLSNPALKISDQKIFNSIYQLQNTVLKNISGLPIPIKIDPTVDISCCTNMDQIKASVMNFLEKLVQEISKKEENEESRLYNTVLEYVEKRYVREDMSLNKAADDLNINKNYLSKIIKEKTGENFPDYIHKKRIALAKELLMNRKKTIEDIAKEVGYNYSYYFIKIFKSIEGITPGQYRGKDE